MPKTHTIFEIHTKTMIDRTFQVEGIDREDAIERLRQFNDQLPIVYSSRGPVMIVSMRAVGVCNALPDTEEEGADLEPQGP